MTPCPRCATALHGIRTPAGPAWDCPRGHGRFALLSVLRGLVASRALDQAWKEAHWGQVSPSCRCPTCNRRMVEVDSSSHRVDVCRPCKSLWLDRIEVEQLPGPDRQTDIPPFSNDPQRELALEQVRALQRRYEDGDPIGGAPNETWKTVVGSLGFPVEIGSMGTRCRPWATWGLCASILAISLLAFSSGLTEAVRQFGFIPADPFRWYGFTWISAFFLHGGLGHLLGNLWFLWLTGDNVEDALGCRRFLILIAAATIAGQLAHMSWDPRADLPCIGASGGISGVLAAYAIRFPSAQIGLAFFWGRLWFRLPAWGWICFWTLGQCVLVWQQVHGFTFVSALAHLGGLAAGAVLAWLWSQKPAPPSTRITSP